jgi:DNA-binding MarR family transcriptional regulator
VAHLARARLESRQRFQPLVRALVGQKLLRYLQNPLHKRSPLVMLTEKGEATVRAVEAREATPRYGRSSRPTSRRATLPPPPTFSIESERSSRILRHNVSSTGAIDER